MLSAERIDAALRDYARWDLRFDIQTGEGYAFRANDDGSITKTTAHHYNELAEAKADLHRQTIAAVLKAEY